MQDNGKILKRFGRQLRIFRKQKMLSRGELASKCMLSVKDIEDMEAGEVDPGLCTIFHFAKILDINPEDLIPPPGGNDNEYYAYKFYILKLLNRLSGKDLKKSINVLHSMFQEDPWKTNTSTRSSLPSSL